MWAGTEDTWFDGMRAMAERRGWPLLALDGLEHAPAFSRPEAVAEVLPFMLGRQWLGAVASSKL